MRSRALRASFAFLTLAFAALLTSLTPLNGIAVASTPPRGTGGSWYRYPLPGAEVKSLVADPALAGVFWAGTAQGGIYRSADGGVSWTSPAGGAPFPGYSVTSLATDPSRPGAVWVGLTGVVKGGLLARSLDLGKTFEIVRRWEERAGARVVAISTSGPKTVGVGGDWGIEISGDDGATWKTSAPALDPGSGVSFLSFDPVVPGVLYCGSFRHPFRSRDGGKTWTRIANGMVEDTEVFAIDFSRDDPNDFWAATCGWVYRTTDGATNWTRYREGLADRRSQAVRVDPRDPNRILVGTTGGLFESRDRGRNFRRISADVVINALVFDPRDPSRLIVGTEAEGVLRSEDGGLTLSESNHGLSEARVSAVAVMPSGHVIVARAADGKSGGLWSVDVGSGDIERLASSPPATVFSLASADEALLAGAPDGIYRAPRPGAAFARVLDLGTRAFASDGSGRILAATDGGVFESTTGGRTWSRLGSLRSRVEDVHRARFPDRGLKTWSADSGGLTLWWDGAEWARKPLPGDGRLLSGGFGRPRAVTQFVPEPIGVALSRERSVLVFRPEDDADGGVSVTMPETGLVVAGWAGDPRTAAGLYLATIGRGLFRFVPGG